MATAVANPRAVRAVAIVAGVGPWRELDDPTWDLEKRTCLDLLDDGDVAGAEAGLSRIAEAEFGGMRALEDEARVDEMLSEPDVAGSPLTRDDDYRALWAANMALVLDRLDGYVFDNLAWGGVWDVDPSDVIAPTLVYDTEAGGATYAHWYAGRITASELVLFPGETHLDACDTHWPEVLAGILCAWT